MNRVLVLGFKWLALHVRRQTSDILPPLTTSFILTKSISPSSRWLCAGSQFCFAFSTLYWHTFVYLSMSLRRLEWWCIQIYILTALQRSWHGVSGVLLHLMTANNKGFSATPYSMSLSLVPLWPYVPFSLFPTYWYYTWIHLWFSIVLILHPYPNWSYLFSLAYL